MSYLDFLHGLHVDAAALAVLHESWVEGIHQDDSAQARSLFALHVIQKHLSFVDFVTDDCGDVRWNDTSTQEHTHTLVWISAEQEMRKQKRKNQISTFLKVSRDTSHWQSSS